MAQTPMDIILKHLSAERDSVGLGNDPADTVDLAIAINEELRREFRIIAPPVPWATNAETAQFGRQEPILLMPPIPEPRPADHDDITIRATNNPMLWYVGTDRVPYRLDEGYPPNSQGFPSGREAQIALALVDVSAARLHKVTR